MQDKPTDAQDESADDIMSGDEVLSGCDKWNWEAFAELLKAHVVYLSQVDSYLAEKISAGHPAATGFVLDLLDHFVLPSLSGVSSGEATASGSTASTVSGLPALADLRANFSNTLNVVNSKREFTVLNEYDLWLTIKAMQARLVRLTSNPTAANDSQTLRLRLSCIRVRGLLDLGLLEDLSFCSPSALYAGCSRAREFDDPPSLLSKTESLIRTWLDLYQNPHQNDAETVETIMLQLQRIGVLWIDENLTRFFRLATIYVLERALKHLKMTDQNSSATVVNSNNFSGNFSAAARVSSYIELDPYARLISIVVNHGSDNPDSPNSKVIIFLLSAIPAA